jgi:hypothetical protein
VESSGGRGRKAVDVVALALHVQSRWKAYGDRFEVDFNGVQYADVLT